MKIFFSIIVLFSLLGFAVWAGWHYFTNQSRILRLDPIAFQTFITESPDVFVLDVHIPEQQHIVGTDALIPYNAISTNLSRLPADKSKPIAVYCRSGGMSAVASAELARLGYTNIADLTGGANAWREAGLPFADISFENSLEN